MDLKKLLDQDDAVSPVIGVILMVAITVILAAVIATFVLGLGDNLSNTAPQASFSFDYTQSENPSSPACEPGGDQGNTLDITHDGGDQIEAQTLTVVADGGSNTWDECSNDGATSDVTAGSTATADISNSATVRLTYQNPDGGSSATLGEFDAPGA